jgi:hypothetical protein
LTWAFEDLLASDAFGVQLLGPGYAGRLDPSDVWEARVLGGDATLVARVDAGAWFDAPFETRWRHWPPGRPHPPVPPVPRVLAAAREEFAPILEAPGAFSRLGVPELER